MDEKALMSLARKRYHEANDALQKASVAYGEAKEAYALAANEAMLAENDYRQVSEGYDGLIDQLRDFERWFDEHTSGEEGTGAWLEFRDRFHVWLMPDD